MSRTAQFKQHLVPVDRRRFEVMIEAYARAHERILAINDPRLFSLPHHRRMQLDNTLAEEARFLETFAPKVTEMARDPYATRHDIMMAMTVGYPELAAGLFADSQEVLLALALRLQVHYGRVRPFQTTDALEAMLRSTDFGEEIPASWFRTPFPATYIEFGEGRAFPVSLNDTQSGEHVVEGAYLFEGMIPSFHSDKLVRGFDIIIFGSPVGKSSVMDDTFVHFGLPIDDESAPISLQVKDAIESYGRVTDQAFPNKEAMRPILEHIAKVLVYLNTRDARKIDVLEARDAKRKIDALKSPGKRDKALRQAARLYDRIVIGPANDSLGADALRGTTGVRPHIRRGHFRMQACGPRMTERRPIWLEPMFVNGFSSSTPASATYLVR